MATCSPKVPRPVPCQTVTVIGIGNPLRRDDGVGYIAAQHLWRDRWDDLPVRVEAHRQLLVEHVDLVRNAAHVVFVDAAVDLPPGDLRAEDVQPADSGTASFHALAPGLLLSLAGSLYGARPPATLVRIGVNDLGPGEGLSPPLRARFDHYCDAIRALVEERAWSLRNATRADG